VYTTNYNYGGYGNQDQQYQNQPYQNQQHQNQEPKEKSPSEDEPVEEPPSPSPSASFVSSYKRGSNWDQGSQYLIVREEDAQGNLMSVKAACETVDIPAGSSSVRKLRLMYEYSLVVKDESNPVTLAQAIEINLVHVLWAKFLNDCSYNSAGWGQALRYLSVSTDPADYVSRQCDRRYQYYGQNCYVIAAGITVEFFLTTAHNNDQGGNRRRRRHDRNLASASPKTMVEHELGELLADLFSEHELLEGVDHVTSVKFMGLTNAGVWGTIAAAASTYETPLLCSALVTGTMLFFVWGKRRLATRRSSQPMIDLESGADTSATPSSYNLSPGLDHNERQSKRGSDSQQEPHQAEPPRASWMESFQSKIPRMIWCRGEKSNESDGYRLEQDTACSSLSATRSPPTHSAPPRRTSSSQRSKRHGHSQPTFPEKGFVESFFTTCNTVHDLPVVE